MWFADWTTFKGEGSIRVLANWNTVQPARRLDLGFRKLSLRSEAETFSLRETETLQRGSRRTGFWRAVAEPEIPTQHARRRAWELVPLVETATGA